MQDCFLAFIFIKLYVLQVRRFFSYGRYGSHIMTSRFEQLWSFRNIFGFFNEFNRFEVMGWFSTKRLLHYIYKYFISIWSCDVELNDLIFELISVMQLTLSDKPMSAMEVFEFVGQADRYRNIFICLPCLIYHVGDYCIS